MRQRVMIAMALACKPDVLIADEPTTALDVTVQAQIFDLISELRERTGTAVMLITHDMGAVAEMTDRMAVMYAGRMVEEGPTDLILSRPSHPYPQGLIGFDRSFFLVQGHDPAAVRCVVAHELTHFLRRHAYLSSRLEQQADQRRRPAAQRDLAQAALSQQQELAADRGALLMTAIAGHDPQACVRQLQEAAELDGDYAPEDPRGTHPGHGRRIAAARAYIAEGLAADRDAWRKRVRALPPVSPRWRWDPQDRLLIVTTRP
jgi:ABC-type sulfate/molybdate transport systems ATPase subunit